MNARLDVWHLNGQTIPEFMSREVRNADKILVLCSPSYRKKVHAMEDEESISGSGWETMLVTSAIWNKHRAREQIVPVLFDGKWPDASPDFLSALPFIDLTDNGEFETNYDSLLRRLTDQQEREPSLGASVTLPAIVTRSLRLSSQNGSKPNRPHVDLAGTAIVPKQLPPPPPDFIGRDNETNKLVNAVRKHGTTTVVVRGMGGIGKTALALAFAARIAPDFPVGQIFLDLKGVQHKHDSSDSRPLPTSEVMDHVIRSFDPTTPTSSTEAEREGRYRTILNGRGVLLLVDNALDAHQVERLAPPSGCIMLITSRQHFALPGALAVDLPILRPKDAQQLLSTISPNIGAHSGKLAKLCGYLPEALRTAASALATAPNLSAAEFLRRMNSARRRLRLTGVELALSTSSELLNAEIRERWFQLGVFPAPFDEPAVAAVWQTSNNGAKKTLTSLLRYSLIEFDSKNKRYSLHDLVRDYCLEQLDQPCLELIRSRHSAYYSEILAAADYLYLLGGTGTALGLTMFDAERAHLVSGQSWAATRAADNKQAARLCLRYAAVGTNVLRLRLNGPKQIKWLTSGIDSAKQLSAPHPGRREIFQSEVVVLRTLAFAYLASENYQRAIEFFDRARERLEDIHQHFGAIYETKGLGDVYRYLGEYRKALELHKEARYMVDLQSVVPVQVINRSVDSFFDPKDSVRKETALLESFGDDYFALGRIATAIGYYSQQLELSEIIGDHRSELRALGRLGASFKADGQYDRAVQFQKRSLLLAERLNDQEGQANAFFNTALALVALEKRPDAIRQAQAALDIYTRIRSPIADHVRQALEKWDHGHLGTRIGKSVVKAKPLGPPQSPGKRLR